MSRTSPILAQHVPNAPNPNRRAEKTAGLRAGSISAAAQPTAASLGSGLAWENISKLGTGWLPQNKSVGWLVGWLVGKKGDIRTRCSGKNLKIRTTPQPSPVTHPLRSAAVLRFHPLRFDLRAAGRRQWASSAAAGRAAATASEGMEVLAGVP